MKTNKFFIAFAAAGLLLASCEKDDVTKDKISFEEVALNEAGIYNGSDMAGGFTSGNAFFKNSYNEDYSSWSVFAVSNHTDTETRGSANQYSSIAGSGADGSANYAIFTTWASDTILFTVPEKVTGISLCNSTYAYYSMLEGDDFAKQFGGNSGEDLDYFSVHLKCFDNTNTLLGTATLNLADYRFTTAAEDYISNIWTNIDLSEAGYIKYIVLSFESSDVGDFGINTPTYVCIDNISGELME